MKILIATILFAVAFAEPEEIDPFLLGGLPTVLGEFPGAVFIRSPGTPNQPFCGGTIINRQHVSFSYFFGSITEIDCKSCRPTRKFPIKSSSKDFYYKKKLFLSISVTGFDKRSMHS